LNPEDLKALVTEVVREVIARGKGGKRVALGSDHGGFDLKTRLKGFLQGRGYQVLDVGTDSKEACDYPDFARAVARTVASGGCEAGIMIDGAGIGSSMVCNKVRGIRAALCYDLKTILNSRQHNDANVLTLGAGANPPELVEEMVQTWLETPFEGGRHQRRVDKIEPGA
jgi:ribose 5-phosphate isomerase B